MNLPSYRVWDLPTRIFHWLIVVLVLAQWASAQWNWLPMTFHFYAGYTTVALVIARIAWGVVGSQSSRFSAFVHGPTTLARYLAQARTRAPERIAGHNPLGGWAVLAMLAALLFQGVTGLFSSDDIALYGPLSEQVSAQTMKLMTRLHKQSADVLLILIGIHLLAIAWHALFKRENLIGPMFSGRKRLADDPGLRFAGIWRALLVVVLSATVVSAVVQLGGG